MAHKPFARGVTQLMYVGDVPSLGVTTTDLGAILPMALLAAGGLWLWHEIASDKKRRRKRRSGY